MTVEQVNSDQLEALMLLSVGDIAELPSMMPNLTTEPTVLQVEEIKNSTVFFRMSFYGVFLSRLSLHMSRKGKFTWTNL